MSAGSCRAKLRAARLLALPCGYFYVSWGPWFGVVLWAVCTGTTVRPDWLARFVQTLAVLNSLGNPVLYALTQPLLGKAMLVKVRSLGDACKRGCARVYSGRKPSESLDLVRNASTSTSTAV